MSSVGISHVPSLTRPTFSPVVIGYPITGLFMILFPMVGEVEPLLLEDAEE